MSSKRPGWRAAERTFKHLSGQLRKKALSSQEKNYRDALHRCVTELRGIHRHAHPTCKNLGPTTCPTWEAIHQAEEALKQKPI